MCGIVGHIGHKNSVHVVLEGLKRLEYRGYDSSGISTIEEQAIVTSKCKGKISTLSLKVDNKNLRLRIFH